MTDSLTAGFGDDDRSLQAFRSEVREFVARELPHAVREKVRLGLEVSKQELVDWQHRLAARGWLVPHWPAAWQGCDWSPERRAVFQEELVLAHAPESGGITFEMIGPILIRYGTPAQQQYFLPRILNQEHWWCQGYSEPNAGSDLASLKTRAVRKTRPDGTEVYVVSGSKIWTSYAQYADWIFCLVRTDTEARAQQGISFLLIDMRSPGVSVRPLVGIHGWHLFNQVFFDEVEVPVGNRVGDENAGWSIAKSLLEHERLNLARVAENRRRLAKVRAIGAELEEGGQPLLQRPWFARRLRALEVRLEALAATVLRFRRQARAGQALGPETGMLKLLGSRLIQDIENLAVDALGPGTLAYDRAAHFEPAAPEPGQSAYAAAASARRFVTRGYTIAGGSSEIQHELLAKQVLGL
ncbi:acyl-CoA dehydrogenase family protein [Cupriavidus taiwanensis]|uniref:acyl-CoA dehydrogenase family protein n=1 Tax=Cupriavidus taiwanensis TaxID=164546 RepID=UPI0025422B35|nr:acyl-CoA dehydrogenase family protein [Cupriavidus taiwanensis]MDK3023175.1 acyl-CoA dehydrogenase family protein [Cupriavidus taiwanensis]